MNARNYLGRIDATDRFGVRVSVLPAICGAPFTSPILSKGSPVGALGAFFCCSLKVARPLPHSESRKDLHAQPGFQVAFALSGCGRAARLRSDGLACVRRRPPAWYADTARPRDRSGLDPGGAGATRSGCGCPYRVRKFPARLLLRRHKPRPDSWRAYSRGRAAVVVWDQPTREARVSLQKNGSAVAPAEPSKLTNITDSPTVADPAMIGPWPRCACGQRFPSPDHLSRHVNRGCRGEGEYRPLIIPNRGPLPW